MKIGELAQKADVTRDTIRHYLSLGLIQADSDPNNGYQLFNQQALSRLGFIRTARQLGLHLSDIKQIFQDADNAHSPCPKVREVMVQRIAETRRTIKELTELCNRMEASMKEWEHMPDSTPNGHSVCRLIESQMPNH